VCGEDLEQIKYHLVSQVRYRRGQQPTEIRCDENLNIY
jgi:hypothetical protein